MRKRFLILAFAAFTLNIINSNAQQFSIPDKVFLDKAEDYAGYEKDVIACVDWLEKVPYNEETGNQKQAYAFLTKWINGAPNVTVIIDPEVANLYEQNSTFLVLFMGGWTRAVLKDSTLKNDKVAGNLAGIRTVLKVYGNNLDKGVKKDKNIEKLMALEKKGELEAYIRKRVK